MDFIRQYLDESVDLIRKLDVAAIEKLAIGLAGVRSGGGEKNLLPPITPAARRHGCFASPKDDSAPHLDGGS